MVGTNSDAVVGASLLATKYRRLGRQQAGSYIFGGQVGSGGSSSIAMTMASSRPFRAG